MLAGYIARRPAAVANPERVSQEREIPERILSKRGLPERVSQEVAPFPFRRRPLPATPHQAFHKRTSETIHATNLVTAPFTSPENSI